MGKNDLVNRASFRTGGWFAWLRRDWPVLLLYGAATLLLTYPLAWRLGGSYIGFADSDTYVKLWDIWQLRRILFADASPYTTQQLFYPVGLDLTFHSISWTVSILALLLTAVTDVITAYNVTILFAVFTTAYAAYLFIRELGASTAAAWLGGAVYSFAPYHIQHSGGHPDLVQLAPVPLALLFLRRALRRNSWRDGVITAVFIGLAAFTSLYILNFLFLTALPYGIYLMLQAQRWRSGRFWRVVGVMGVATAAVLLLRLWPTLQNPAALTRAIESKYIADMGQTDLLALITPSQFNPLFAPLSAPIADTFAMNKRWPAYLGVIPLWLTAVALIWRQRNTWFWFGVGVFFLLLALGPTLRVWGHLITGFKMPAAYLAGLPPIRVVGRPDFFVLALLLPLGICTAFGLERVLSRLNGRSRLVVTLLVSFVLLFEYWNGPYPMRKAAVNPFYQQIAATPGDFALIDLPMGRQPSKRYVYRQTVHQKPIVEGLSARTPAKSYDYIKSNALLQRWRYETALNCTAFPPEMMGNAVERLLADNFRYVTISKIDGRIPDEYDDYFAATAPTYQDDRLIVFSLQELHQNLPCS